MDEPSVKRRLSWLGIAAIGLGGANASIYVLAQVLNGQGSFAIPLLFIGLVFAVMAAPGYAELVLMYPNKSGGIAAVCSDAFHPYNPVLANLAGTCYWFSWVPIVGFAPIIAATVAQQNWLPWISVNWLGTGIILAITALTFCGLSWVQRMIIPIAALGATLAILSCLIPVVTGHVNLDDATHFDLKVAFTGVFGQISSVMAGLYLVGWVAPAFEVSLCYVADTKDPQKNIPRGLFFALIFSILYFAICPIIWLGVLGQTSMMKDMLGQELWSAYVPVMGPMANAAAAWFMIFNTFVTIIAALIGPPRALAQLAKDGLLPESLGYTSKLDVPVLATITTALGGIAIIWCGTPIWLMAATNFDYLIAMSLPSVAVWLLRRDDPNAIRLYRAPKGFIALGLVSAAIWLLATVLGFQQYEITTILTGICLAFLGVFLYLLRKAIDRVRENKPILPKSLHIKLTGTMVVVLVIDALGYLLALQHIAVEGTALNAALKDVFIMVAFLTLSVGLVLPGMTVHAVEEVNKAAQRLISGTLADFTKAMQALGRGNLDAAHASKNIVPVHVHSRDEIGDMAEKFNEMQNEILKSVVGLDGARIGLQEARDNVIAANNELANLNDSLEARVSERTEMLQESNFQLNIEIQERIKAEERAAILSAKLVDSARVAGMADVATNVLHNVGNILNSVNVSTSLIQERVTKFDFAKLKKLVEMIRKNDADLAMYFTKDAQGANVLRYLAAMSNSLEAEKSFVLNEIKLLEKNVGDIKNVIASQQSLVVCKSMVELIDVRLLLEDVVKFNHDICEQEHISIVCDFVVMKMVALDKVKMMRVVSDLIKNSIDSLIECNSVCEKQIKLSVLLHDDDSFEVAIRDNGVGIMQENITKVFLQGYTTKKNNCGLGLHSCALLVNEMGGSLTVESEGEGMGAVFTMVLPYHYNYTGNAFDKKTESAD